MTAALTFLAWTGGILLGVFALIYLVGFIAVITFTRQAEKALRASDLNDIEARRAARARLAQ